MLNYIIGPSETFETFETFDTADTPRGTLMDTDQEIIEALQSAQAALNPLSGFLRKGTPITRRYLETVRDQIDAALTKMIVRAAPAMGEVVIFPKAKRPIPAGHENGEQPNLRALAHAVRLGKARPPTKDGSDGPAAA